MAQLQSAHMQTPMEGRGGPEPFLQVPTISHRFRRDPVSKIKVGSNSGRPTWTLSGNMHVRETEAERETEMEEGNQH